MSDETGTNSTGIHRIMEMIRAASIFILLIHFYYYCYNSFLLWKLTGKIVDQFILNLSHTGLFIGCHAKLVAIGLLIVSLAGSGGRKDEKLKKSSIFIGLVLGFLFIS